MHCDFTDEPVQQKYEAGLITRVGALTDNSFFVLWMFSPIGDEEVCSWVVVGYWLLHKLSSRVAGDMEQYPTWQHAQWIEHLLTTLETFGIFPCGWGCSLNYVWLSRCSCPLLTGLRDVDLPTPFVLAVWEIFLPIHCSCKQQCGSILSSG